MLVQGKAKWAKITGEPSWGFESKFKEWSIDVYFDEDTIKRLKAENLNVKDKGNGGYMSFKRKELKADGSANQPIRIVDHRGEAWDPKVKIGNGSTVNVNFALNEYKPGQVNANILSLQVWDLVKYEGGEFQTREGPASLSETGAEDWSADETAS